MPVNAWSVFDHIVEQVTITSSSALSVEFFELSSIELPNYTVRLLDNGESTISLPVLKQSFKRSEKLAGLVTLVPLVEKGAFLAKSGTFTTSEGLITIKTDFHGFTDSFEFESFRNLVLLKEGDSDE